MKAATPSAAQLMTPVEPRKVNKPGKENETGKSGILAKVRMWKSSKFPIVSNKHLLQVPTADTPIGNITTDIGSASGESNIGSFNNSINITHHLSGNECTPKNDFPIKPPVKKTVESFRIVKLLGKGSFGEVFLVEDKETGVAYAMKVIHKTKILSMNLTRYAITEKRILASSNHPFIVKLHYSFQTQDLLFLIMDYCPGGDLSQYIQREKRFSEEVARLYAAEVVLALEHLHRHNIVYRDLKPENIVLNAKGHAVLTDFGLAKENMKDTEVSKSFCGSFAYLAPEVVTRSGHGKSVDWYHLGVLIYEMLVGQTPYYSGTRSELFTNIVKGKLVFPDYVSDRAKSLITELLNRIPSKRLGAGPRDAEEIKTHPFFHGLSWKDTIRQSHAPALSVSCAKPVEGLGTMQQFFTKPALLTASKFDGWTFIGSPMFQEGGGK